MICRNRVLVLSMLIIFLASCTEKYSDVEEFQVALVLFGSDSKQQLKEIERDIAVSYLCDNNTGRVPIITAHIPNSDELKSYEITSSITGRKDVADRLNVNYINNFIWNKQYSKVVNEVDFESAANLGIEESEEIIKSFRDNNFEILVIGDNKNQVSTDDFSLNFENIVCGKKKIAIVFNSPKSLPVPPPPPKEPTECDLVNLRDKEIAERISQSKGDWKLYYERAINQITCKGTKRVADALKKYINEGAKMALLASDGDSMLMQIIIDKDTKLKSLFSIHSARIEGTIIALENNDLDLIDVPIKYLHSRIGRTKRNKLFIPINDIYTHVSDKRSSYSIAVNGVDNNGTIDITINLPLNPKDINKKIILERNVSKQFEVSGDEKRWEVDIINLTNFDPNIVYLGVDIKEYRIEKINNDQPQIGNSSSPDFDSEL